MIFKLKNILNEGLKTFHHYPLILLFAFISAVSIIFNYEYPNKYTIKIFITASLGISLFFALQTTFEKHKYKFLAYSFGGILLAIFYLFILDNIHTPKSYDIIIYIAWFLSSFLIVSFLPFIFNRWKEDYFWEYNKNLFINILLSFNFVGIFTIGIIFSLLSIFYLFNVEIPTKIYFYFGIVFSIFGNCFIFLNLFCNQHKNTQYPVLLKFFTQFILIPLLIIYGGILYLYGIKILFLWELPRGMVSFMIMIYCSMGIFAFLLVHPLKDAKVWVRFFFKIFHYSILPLLILLFTAILTRISDYNITEFRYFVLLYAIWISFICFYFIFNKKAHIKIIPISLFCFIIFSIYAPFLNSFSLSKYSQKLAFERVLTEYGLLKDNGKIDFNKEISYETAENIASKMEFLYNHNEDNFVLNHIEKEEQKKFKKSPRHQDFIDYFNIKENSSISLSNSEYSKISISRNIPLHKNYDYYIEINYDNYISINDKDSILYNDKEIIIKSNNKEYKYIFENELKEYIKKNENKNDNAPVSFILGDYEGLLFSDIYYNKKKGKSPLYYDIQSEYSATILLKKP